MRDNSQHCNNTCFNREFIVSILSDAHRYSAFAMVLRDIRYYSYGKRLGLASINMKVG